MEDQGYAVESNKDERTVLVIALRLNHRLGIPTKSVHILANDITALYLTQIFR